MVRQLHQLGAREIAGLCEVLIDCVAGGASVSFMWPLTPARAEAYWQGVAASVARGERLVYAAEDESGEMIGTVTIVLAQPENQPHRGDLSKMLVHRRARRRGLGGALLSAAERGALAAGKTLLVLDTASAEAERLYTRHGWQRVGEVPQFALLPNGEPCATVFYYKQLG